MPTTKPRTARPVPTFDHLMKRQRPERSLTFCDDADAIADVNDAKQAVGMASLDSNPQRTAEARQALADAKRRLQDNPAAMTLQLRAIGQSAFDRLMRAHPPTQKQLDDAKAEDGDTTTGRPQYDPQAFYPALLAVTIVEPVIDAVQAQQLLDEWSTGDTNELVRAAMTLNQTPTTVDLGF